jgi:hypothetical protein
MLTAQGGRPQQAPGRGKAYIQNTKAVTGQSVDNERLWGYRTEAPEAELRGKNVTAALVTEKILFSTTACRIRGVSSF